MQVSKNKHVTELNSETANVSCLLYASYIYHFLVSHLVLSDSRTPSDLLFTYPETQFRATIRKDFLRIRVVSKPVGCL